MNTPDDFSQYHAELLDGIYDCVDRIVLNAFFSMGQTGGGMRSWWRSDLDHPASPRPPPICGNSTVTPSTEVIAASQSTETCDLGCGSCVTSNAGPNGAA